MSDETPGTGGPGAPHVALVSKGQLLITTQAVLKQPRDYLPNPDTNAAQQHQQFTVVLTHGSTQNPTPASSSHLIICSRRSGSPQEWMMVAFAELERDMIHQRTMAGLTAARAQGRVGGRPTALDPDKLAAARARLARGESTTQIAKALKVSRATLYRHIDIAAARAGA